MRRNYGWLTMTISSILVNEMKILAVYGGFMRRVHEFDGSIRLPESRGGSAEV